MPGDNEDHVRDEIRRRNAIKQRVAMAQMQILIQEEQRLIAEGKIKVQEIKPRTYDPPEIYEPRGDGYRRPRKGRFNQYKGRK